MHGRAPPPVCPYLVQVANVDDERAIDRRDSVPLARGQEDMQSASIKAADITPILKEDGEPGEVRVLAEAQRCRRLRLCPRAGSSDLRTGANIRSCG